MTYTEVLEPPGGQPPPTPSSGDTRAPLRLVVMALALGLALDLGLRGGPANALVVAGVMLLIALLASDGRIQQGEAKLVVGAAAVPAVFLAIRLSPWLVASNLIAVGGLLAAAVAYSRSGTVLHATPVALLRRLHPALQRALRPHRLLGPIMPAVSRSTGDKVARAGTAALIALPLLAVVAGLLAAADPVFAALLLPEVDAAPLLGHLALIALFALGGLGLAAASSGDAEDRAGAGSFGVVEVATMLALAAGVLGLFVASQLIALTGAGRRLVESSGLTPAEYARSGFFQLCWATATLLAFLGVVRRLAAPDAMCTRSIRALAALVPLLALGLVIVSLRRMALYDDAFGLTMLRIWAVGAVAWMGAVLVMVAMRNSGLAGDREWVLAGAGGVALALLLLANVVNVEAFVVRHNVQRAERGAEVDALYLGTLSDDALPALADAAAHVRSDLRAAIACRPDAGGVAALNLSAARAADVRRSLCGT